MQFNPGKYYVGDLCYVLGERWDEVCSLIISGNNVLDGAFALKDGTVFWLHGTAYGDGSYYDDKGRRYAVDAGIIGVVSADQIDQTPNFVSGGQIITFNKPVVPRYEDGVFYIGDVVINTADDDYQEDDDEDY